MAIGIPLNKDEINSSTSKAVASAVDRMRGLAEVQMMYYHVIPNSHSWASIEQLINNLEHEILVGNKPKKEYIEYLIVGLKNVISGGYNIQKVKTKKKKHDKRRKN